MTEQLSESIWQILACPNCQYPLDKASHGAECCHCGEQFRFAASGSLDLRLHRAKSCVLEFDLLERLPAAGTLDFQPLTPNQTPEVDYSTADVPRHLSRELLGYFPRAEGENSLMLDLGCGSTIHREVCELAGFEYVGVDYSSPQAPILGDAHSLSFKDSSFDFVLSIAVLEHIRYPLVMMREVYRILKPGGTFIGTVAFLEPFHSDSFYHHTHLGVVSSLEYGGFKVEKVAPSRKHSVLVAQAKSALFPRMPRSVSIALVMPLYLLHQLWWRIGSSLTGRLDETVRILTTTGAFSFVARKDAATNGDSTT
ncbi:class I SAM-dependent methyltransferase [Chloroflexota bacterium]